MVRSVLVVAALTLVARTATASAPVFNATPNPADFGNVPVGTASMPLAITISNGGNAVLHLKSFAILGADSADFTSMDPVKPLPLSLNPNSMLSFHVVLKPSHAGAESASVAIQNDDPNQPNATIALTGTGAMPQLQATPMALDFGSVTVGGASPPLTVMLSNTGNSAAKIDSIKLTGANPDQFAVDMAGPLMLAPNASATVRAKFVPTMVAPASASITFAAQGAKVEVPLTGMATPPSLSVSTMMLDYGVLGVGTASDPQTVAVKNTGQSPLTIAGVASSDMQFPVDQSKTALQLGPGVVTTFSVSFHPLKLGDQSSQIAISLKGAPMVASVLAYGTGVQPVLDMGAPAGPLDLRMGDLAGSDLSRSPDLGDEVAPFRHTGGCSVGGSSSASSLPPGRALVALGLLALVALRRRRR